MSLNILRCDDVPSTPWRNGAGLARDLLHWPEPAGWQLRISVADNGKGIPEENIQRLFQAFYSGRTGGMGLGLTNARTILNAHGVHMDVKSTVGEGTTFLLTFPE